MAGDFSAREVLGSYSLATGFPAARVDARGRPAEEPDGLAGFCRAVRSRDEGRDLCQLSCARAAAEAARFGFPYIFRCHAGLVNWAASLGAEKGAFVSGGVLLWSPDEYFVREVEATARLLDIPFEELRSAADALPRVEAGRVKAAADLLLYLASSLEPGADLSVRRRMTEEQSRLGEAMAGRKRRPVSRSPYPLPEEERLLTLVRQGDSAGALDLLNELIAGLLARYGGETEAIRRRFRELTILLGRAAAEGGAPVEEIGERTEETLERLEGDGDIGDLSHHLIEAAAVFAGAVAELRHPKHRLVLEEVRRFVAGRTGRAPTVAEIARAVDLSPGYLSHLFKREMGLTLGEYVVRERLNRAKALLREGGRSAREVAEATGFKDQSHFSKTFRKLTGLTPTGYRRRSG